MSTESPTVTWLDWADVVIVAGGFGALLYLSEQDAYRFWAGGALIGIGSWFAITRWRQPWHNRWTRMQSLTMGAVGIFYGCHAWWPTLALDRVGWGLILLIVASNLVRNQLAKRATR